MKMQKTWFVFGAVATIFAVVMRFTAERVMETIPALMIVVRVMDLFLLVSGMMSLVIFHGARKDWYSEEIKKPSYSIESYSFANGVLCVWAGFLIALMSYRLSN